MSENQLKQCQQAAEEVTEIMLQNYNRVLDREGKLSELDERADELQKQSYTFTRTTETLAQKKRRENARFRILLVALVVGVILLIISAIILYFTLSGSGNQEAPARASAGGRGAGPASRPGHGVLLRGARLRARSPDGRPAAAPPRPAGAGQVPLPRAGDRRGRPAERRLGSPAPAASRPQRRGRAARGAGGRRAGSEGAPVPGVPAGIRGGGGGQADALPAPLPRRLPPPLARKDQLLPALPPRAAHRGPGVRGVQAGEGPQGAASAPAGVSAWRHVYVSPARSSGPRHGRSPLQEGRQKSPPFAVLFLSKNSTPQSSEGFLTNKNSARLYFQG